MEIWRVGDYCSIPPPWVPRGFTGVGMHWRSGKGANFVKYYQDLTLILVSQGEQRCYNICPADLEFSGAPDVTDFFYESRKVANVLVVDKSKTCVSVGIRLWYSEFHNFFFSNLFLWTSHYSSWLLNCITETVVQ